MALFYSRVWLHFPLSSQSVIFPFSRAPTDRAGEKTWELRALTALSRGPEFSFQHLGQAVHNHQ